MLTQGRGVFINVSRSVRSYPSDGTSPHVHISTGYTRPRAGIAFYNASKAAVTVPVNPTIIQAFSHLSQTATKTMALEYAPAIRFNCIAPAVGNTTM